MVGSDKIDSSKEGYDASGVSLQSQRKKAKQQRATAEAKLTRKLEKFPEYISDKVALEIWRKLVSGLQKRMRKLSSSMNKIAVYKMKTVMPY